MEGYEVYMEELGSMSGQSGMEALDSTGTGGKGQAKTPYSRRGPAGKLWLAAIVLAAAAVTTVSGGLLLFKGRPAGETAYRTYTYHIAMIADETDTSFWADVYRGAVEAGAAHGAYVEQIGEGLEDKFSMEDSINMAIYEHVDGILLKPSDEKTTQEMIDKACSHQIPVITMQKDVPDSKRQGFVGINDYFLGQEYGKRVLKIADEDTHLVTVLFPGASFNATSQYWFKSGLKNTVQGGISGSTSVSYGMIKGLTMQRM